MQITFETTGKRQRHIYRIIGKMTVLRHLDGRPDSDVESTAIAQGYIPGYPENVEEQIAAIETTADNKLQICKAFSKWASTAKPWEYGSDSDWMVYEIRRN